MFSNMVSARHLEFQNANFGYRILVIGLLYFKVYKVSSNSW